MIAVITPRGSCHLDVRRDGASWVVDLNGHRRRLDLRRNGAIWSLLDMSQPVSSDGTVPARSHAVAIDTRGDGQFRVYVDGCPVTVRVPALARPGRRHRGSVSQGRGAQVVVAPMPGRVVKVLVRVGERVAERQALVVIEAMKMQNELRAARAGVVGDVQTSEGALVEAGAHLLVVTPEARSEGTR